MKKEKQESQFKKTQTASSPGALGEDVNRDKRQHDNPINHEDNKTSKGQGLNEQNSAGEAGAFEGLENSDNS